MTPDLHPARIVESSAGDAARPRPSFRRRGNRRPAAGAELHAQLGGPDSDVKNKIFGLNSAKMYKCQINAEYEPLTHDKLALIKQEYEQAGAQRNNAYYGFVPKTA
jgi:hypothetical protein